MDNNLYSHLNIDIPAASTVNDSRIDLGQDWWMCGSYLNTTDVNAGKYAYIVANKPCFIIFSNITDVKPDKVTISVYSHYLAKYVLTNTSYDYAIDFVLSLGDTEAHRT